VKRQKHGMQLWIVVMFLLLSSACQGRSEARPLASATPDFTATETAPQTLTASITPSPTLNYTATPTSTSSPTPSATPSQLKFVNGSIVGRQIMLGFDAPEKITLPYKLTITINGEPVVLGLQSGVYDPKHPERIFVSGPWQHGDKVTVMVSTGETSYQASLTVPVVVAPTPTPGYYNGIQ
jgi:hypothetical protein